MLSRSDREQANGADDGAVAKAGLGGDGAVGDVVINGLRDTKSVPSASSQYRSVCNSPAAEPGSTYRVLLLLHLQDRAILESPLDNIRLLGSSLDPLAGLQLAPELGELRELDQVPDVAQRRVDDSGLGDGVGSWDLGSHSCSCWRRCRKFSVDIRTGMVWIWVGSEAVVGFMGS